MVFNSKQLHIKYKHILQNIAMCFLHLHTPEFAKVRKHIKGYKINNFFVSFYCWSYLCKSLHSK